MTLLMHVQLPVTIILRVYALYDRSILVIVFLLSLLAVQISTSGAGVHTGFGTVKSPTVKLSCLSKNLFTAVPFPSGVAGGDSPAYYLTYSDSQTIYPLPFVGCILSGTNSLLGEFLVYAMHYQ